MIDVFLQTFSKYVHFSDILVLAVSGGVDSMALFDMVKKHHPNEKLIVTHFNHSLRGKDSDDDSELVANICNNEKIICEIEKMDIGGLAKTAKKSIEHIAREERYRFFRKVKEKYGAKYILTAHHSDDQVETILMGMVKGGKIRGLSGMSIVVGDIFRPLLAIQKEALYQYAKENSLIYHEDITNSDTHFERNHIRKNIVPLFQKINPTVDQTLSELGIYMQELGIYMQEQIADWLIKSANKSGKGYSFFRHDFLSETVFFEREIIAHLYVHTNNGSTQGLSKGNIEECIRFIREASNSHGIKEIKNLRLERRGERIYYGN